MHVYHATRETEMTSLHPQLLIRTAHEHARDRSVGIIENRMNAGVIFEVMSPNERYVRGSNLEFEVMSPKEVRTIRQSNVPLQVFVDRDQQEGTFNFEQTVSPLGQVSMVSAVMEICTDLQ